MKLLAISTSDQIASVALLCDGILTDDRECDRTKNHSETLLPAVDELLAAHRLTLNKIDAFAADIGPGSFTGIRIGISTMNAISLALKKPLYGIDSLTALAARTNADGSICPILDARNGNGYASLFYGKTLKRGPEAIVIDEFLKEIPADTLFIGSGALLHRESILRLTHTSSFLEEGNTVSASGVALAAWDLIEAGEKGMSVLTPLYIRPSQVERLNLRQ